MEKAEPPFFAVFDFDNTCITNDIEESTLRYMACHNLFLGKYILESKVDYPGTELYSKDIFDKYYKLLESGKIKEAYEFSSRILSGYAVKKIGPLVKQIARSEGEKNTEIRFWGQKLNKGINVRPQIIELMDFLKNNGVAVWVVSASPEVLVREAMSHFGIDANVLGINIITKDNKFTTDLEYPLPMFEGKVECIKKFIDPDKKPLLGVGDSINDLPMLEYSEIKVVVDCKNSLAAKARKNNWFLI
jgi:HAD superfamily phosphoserine phosphatase-like hydrolase